MSLFTEFTFKDTGITLKIRKVSPMMADEIRRAIPEPQAPLQPVDYGAPKGVVMEANLSDPAYLDAHAKWQRDVAMKTQRLMILRAVKVEGEEWKADVAEYRAFMETNTGKPLEEENDLLVYINHICVGTQEDMVDFVTAITRRSQPTQEEVERSKASFRSQI